MDVLIDALIKQGGLVALGLAMFAFALHSLQTQLSAAQDARTADAKTVMTQVLDLVQNHHEVTTALEQTMATQSTAIHSLTDEIRQLRAQLIATSATRRG
jgi:hypothetical protein